SARGRLRLSGGFGPPARLAAGALRADRRLRAQGLLPGEGPRDHRRRPHARGAHLVRAGEEERGRALAEIVMGTRVELRARRRGGACRALGLACGAALASVTACGSADAAPLAHREVLPNGIVLLVAERPAVPIVARNMSVIQAAIKRSEEDPGTVAARALSRLVFDGHAYGRPVEGTRESVGRLTRDDVVKFYRERSRPGTTVVAVVGAVTVDEARREIMARFG